VSYKSHQRKKVGKRTNNIGTCTHSEFFSAGHTSLTCLHPHTVGTAGTSIDLCSQVQCRHLHGDIRTMKTYYSYLVHLSTWPSPSCSIFSRGPKTRPTYSSTECDQKSDAQKLWLDKATVLVQGQHLMINPTLLCGFVGQLPLFLVLIQR
jgi:hypothetical protein